MSLEPGPYFEGSATSEKVLVVTFVNGANEELSMEALLVTVGAEPSTEVPLVTAGSTFFEIVWELDALVPRGMLATAMLAPATLAPAEVELSTEELLATATLAPTEVELSTEELLVIAGSTFFEIVWELDALVRRDILALDTIFEEELDLTLLEVALELDLEVMEAGKELDLIEVGEEAMWLLEMCDDEAEVEVLRLLEMRDDDEVEVEVEEMRNDNELEVDVRKDDELEVDVREDEIGAGEMRNDDDEDKDLDEEVDEEAMEEVDDTNETLELDEGQLDEKVPPTPSFFRAYFIQKA
jgi:hypothetical protein